jgi:4-diphosphocytidyl-2-C-methyl-D-erythritol kinase
MRLLAPAKINLLLRVGRRRPDGFHSVLTWMCTVGLFDTITIRPAAPPGAGLSMTCDEPGLPTDGGNLVMRAAQALAPHSRGGRGAAMHLEKRIPSGAGLGGGSSDAARVFVALARLWQVSLDSQRLEEIAAGIGSDVPFFLGAASAICRGRGQHVRSAPPPRPKAVVLILPGVHLATAAVYRRFDEMGLGDDAAVSEQKAPDLQAWADLPAHRLALRLVNDLEPAAEAICPELASIRAMATEIVGWPVRMSGSGSSLFSLHDSMEDAQRAAGLFEAGRIGVRAVAAELGPAIQDELVNPVAPESHELRGRE